MKRSGKFYFKNEKRTLEALGLDPAPQSGGGWIVKEDGENERCMVQLKSTDASSYRINMLDIKKLEYHAMVSNKIPVFLVQFLEQGKLYAIVNIENLEELPGVFDKREVKRKHIIFIEKEGEEVRSEKKVLISSKKSREKFNEERRKLFEGKKRK